jgi:hypothetical protein
VPKILSEIGHVTIKGQISPRRINKSRLTMELWLSMSSWDPLAAPTSRCKRGHNDHVEIGAAKDTAVRSPSDPKGGGES